jgi:ATP-dependent DNA helicase RecG
MTQTRALSVRIDADPFGGNRTYYVPGRRMALDPRQPGRDPHQVDADPRQAGPDPHQPRPKAPSSPLLAALPESLQARISAAGIRPRKETVRSLLRDICAVRAFAARELAEILQNRDAKWLVREHLVPMVEEGQLVHTVPAMPNHPDQKYALPASQVPTP